MGDFVIVKDVVWVMWLVGFIIKWEKVYLLLSVVVFLGVVFMGREDFWLIKLWGFKLLVMSFIVIFWFVKFVSIFISSGL